MKVVHYRFAILPYSKTHWSLSVRSVGPRQNFIFVLAAFFIQYVYEYPVLPQDMTGLIPCPGVLLIGYRPMFMYPVRPFATVYSV